MTGRLALLAGVAVAVLASAPVQAAVISTYVNRPLTTIPSVVTLPSGTLSFNSTDTGFGTGAAVSTAGSTQVTTIFGGVADYGSGTTFDGTASYASFTTPSTIPFSAADDFIGFTYVGTDGTHFGYAEVNGPTLVGYAYESVAGNSITANSVTMPVPEPASMVLLAGGLAGLGLIRRKRSRA